MTDILLAIGVPLMAVFILTLLRAVASGKRLSLETSEDTALDMTFLAIGAAGGVFNDSKVHAMLGEAGTAYLLGLIFLDLIVASILFYMRRFYSPLNVWRAFFCLFLGSVALMAVAGVIYSGAKHHV